MAPDRVAYVRLCHWPCGTETGAVVVVDDVATPYPAGWTAAAVVMVTALVAVLLTGQPAAIASAPRATRAKGPWALSEHRPLRLRWAVTGRRGALRKALFLMERGTLACRHVPCRVIGPASRDWACCTTVSAPGKKSPSWPSDHLTTQGGSRPRRGAMSSLVFQARAPSAMAASCLEADPAQAKPIPSASSARGCSARDVGLAQCRITRLG